MATKHEIEIETAKTGLENGAAYSLKASGNGALPALLALLLAEGKPGEHLIREGYSYQGHMELVVDYVKRKLARGEAADSIAKNLKLSSAGNTSQFRQALPKLVIIMEEPEGEFGYGAIHPNATADEPDASAADC
jgi:hypothetical protein